MRRRFVTRRHSVVILRPRVRYPDMLGTGEQRLCVVRSSHSPCGLALGRFPRSQFAVALAAFQQMPAHGVSGLFRRMGADRLKDRLVLLLDTGKVLARAFRVALKRANALPRNDQAAEKIQEFDEAAVLRGGRDRLVEREIFLDRAITAGDGAAEDAMGLPDRLDLCSGR